jgi:hypothetical protein
MEGRRKGEEKRKDGERRRDGHASHAMPVYLPEASLPDKAEFSDHICDHSAPYFHVNNTFDFISVS